MLVNYSSNQKYSQFPFSDHLENGVFAAPRPLCGVASSRWGTPAAARTLPAKSCL